MGAALILCWSVSWSSRSLSTSLWSFTTGGIQLSAPQWRQAQELKNILQKSYLVTKKLQLHALTPDYFFSKMDRPARDVFQVHDSIIAGEILKSMKKRRQGCS